MLTAEEETVFARSLPPELLPAHPAAMCCVRPSERKSEAAVILHWKMEGQKVWRTLRILCGGECMWCTSVTSKVSFFQVASGFAHFFLLYPFSTRYNKSTSSERLSSATQKRLLIYKQKLPFT